MARVKDEVIDVMERDGVQCAEAMQILGNEWALDALVERHEYAEVGSMFDGFTFTSGGE